MKNTADQKRLFMKKRVILLAGWLMVLAAVSSRVQAGDFRRIGVDYRSMAMGNTGIVSSTGSAALFYNPAALSNVFSWRVDIVAAQATFSDSVFEGGDGAGVDNGDEALDLMSSYIGKNLYAQGSYSHSLVKNFSEKGLTFGVNITNETIGEFQIRNPSNPEISAFLRGDDIRQVGVSVPIGLGKLVVGVEYKTISRKELEFTYTTMQAINNDPFPSLDELSNKGSGGGYEIGFIYRTATAARVMFGGVWRSDMDLSPASSIPAQLDLGVGLRQEYGEFRMLAALDLRDITRQLGSEEKDPDDKSFNRRVHCGVEVGVFPRTKNTSWLSLRWGINQSYITYGAEIVLYDFIRIGYTDYTEEIGEWAGQKPSQRKTFFLAVGF
ncbi:hypothetical protein KKA14_21220 [bacterium]|nr:hypothetical protein [bacterium]